MYQIESFDCISRLDNTGDVYLACALTYHLNIYVPLCKRSEHPPRNPNHISHLFAH